MSVVYLQTLLSTRDTKSYQTRIQNKFFYKIKLLNPVRVPSQLLQDSNINVLNCQSIHVMKHMSERGF